MMMTTVKPGVSIGAVSELSPYWLFMEDYFRQVNTEDVALLLPAAGDVADDTACSVPALGLPSSRPHQPELLGTTLSLPIPEPPPLQLPPSPPFAVIAATPVPAVSPAVGFLSFPHAAANHLTSPRRSGSGSRAAAAGAAAAVAAAIAAQKQDDDEDAEAQLYRADQWRSGAHSGRHSRYDDIKPASARAGQPLSHQAASHAYAALPTPSPYGSHLQLLPPPPSPGAGPSRADGGYEPALPASDPDCAIDSLTATEMSSLARVLGLLSEPPAVVSTSARCSGAASAVVTSQARALDAPDMHASSTTVVSSSSAQGDQSAAVQSGMEGGAGVAEVQAAAQRQLCRDTIQAHVDAKSAGVGCSGKAQAGAAALAPLPCALQTTHLTTRFPCDTAQQSAHVEHAATAAFNGSRGGGLAVIVPPAEHHASVLSTNGLPPATAPADAVAAATCLIRPDASPAIPPSSGDAAAPDAGVQAVAEGSHGAANLGGAPSADLVGGAGVVANGAVGQRDVSGAAGPASDAFPFAALADAGPSLDGTKAAMFGGTLAGDARLMASASRTSHAGGLLPGTTVSTFGAGAAPPGGSSSTLSAEAAVMAPAALLLLAGCGGGSGAGQQTTPGRLSDAGATDLCNGLASAAAHAHDGASWQGQAGEQDCQHVSGSMTTSATVVAADASTSRTWPYAEYGDFRHPYLDLVLAQPRTATSFLNPSAVPIRTDVEEFTAANSNGLSSAVRAPVAKRGGPQQKRSMPNVVGGAPPATQGAPVGMPQPLPSPSVQGLPAPPPVAATVAIPMAVPATYATVATTAAAQQRPQPTMALQQSFETPMAPQLNAFGTTSAAPPSTARPSVSVEPFASLSANHRPIADTDAVVEAHNTATPQPPHPLPAAAEPSALHAQGSGVPTTHWADAPSVLPPLAPVVAVGTAQRGSGRARQSINYKLLAGKRERDKQGDHHGGSPTAAPLSSRLESSAARADSGGVPGFGSGGSGAAPRVGGDASGPRPRHKQAKAAAAAARPPGTALTPFVMQQDVSTNPLAAGVAALVLAGCPAGDVASQWSQLDHAAELLSHAPDDEILAELLVLQTELLQQAAVNRARTAAVLQAALADEPVLRQAALRRQANEEQMQSYVQRKAEIKRNAKRDKREQERRQALAALEAPLPPPRLATRPSKLMTHEGHESISPAMSLGVPAYMDSGGGSAEAGSELVDTLAHRMGDEEAVCAICGDGTSVEPNEIVFCERCDVAVHQLCYGVGELPSGEWLCWPCLVYEEQQLAQGVPQAKVRPPRYELAQRASPVLEGGSLSVACCLCPVRHGAFLRCADTRQWCHAVCALWHPETSMSAGHGCDAILGCANVKADRLGVPCSLCRKSQGAVVKCGYGHCQCLMHPLCARRAGGYLACKLQPSGGGTVRHVYRTYCPSHSEVARARELLLKPVKATNDVPPAAANMDMPMAPPPAAAGTRRRSEAAGVSQQTTQQQQQQVPPPPSLWQMPHPLPLPSAPLPASPRPSSQAAVASPSLALPVTPAHHLPAGTASGAPPLAPRTPLQFFAEREKHAATLLSVRYELEDMRLLCDQVHKREKVKRQRDKALGDLVQAPRSSVPALLAFLGWPALGPPPQPGPGTPAEAAAAEVPAPLVMQSGPQTLVDPHGVEAMYPALAAEPQLPPAGPGAASSSHAAEQPEAEHPRDDESLPAARLLDDAEAVHAPDAGDSSHIKQTLASSLLSPHATIPQPQAVASQHSERPSALGSQAQSQAVPEPHAVLWQQVERPPPAAFLPLDGATAVQGFVPLSDSQQLPQQLQLGTGQASEVAAAAAAAAAEASPGAASVAEPALQVVHDAAVPAAAHLTSSLGSAMQDAAAIPSAAAAAAQQLSLQASTPLAGVASDAQRDDPGSMVIDRPTDPSAVTQPVLDDHANCTGREASDTPVHGVSDVAVSDTLKAPVDPAPLVASTSRQQHPGRGAGRGRGSGGKGGHWGLRSGGHPAPSPAAATDEAGASTTPSATLSTPSGRAKRGFVAVDETVAAAAAPLPAGPSEHVGRGRTSGSHGVNGGASAADLGTRVGSPGGPSVGGSDRILDPGNLVSGPAGAVRRRRPERDVIMSHDAAAKANKHLPPSFRYVPAKQMPGHKGG